MLNFEVWFITMNSKTLKANVSNEQIEFERCKPSSKASALKKVDSKR